MPAGDGTGPTGTGGFCTPLWMSGQIPRPLGGFFGRGSFGRRAPGMGGRGRGNMYRFYATGVPGWALDYPGVAQPIPQQQTTQQQAQQTTPQPAQPFTPFQQPTKEQEIQFLEQQQKALQEEQRLIKQDMEDLKKRIKELRRTRD